MSSRGGGFRRKKPPSMAKKADECSKCARIEFPFLTDSVRTIIKDRIKDDWNEEKMPSIQSNTCRCYNFLLSEAEMSDWKDSLLKSGVNVKISKCNNRTKIQLVSNGRGAHQIFLQRVDGKRKQMDAESKRKTPSSSS